LRKNYNREALKDMYEKYLVFCIVGPGLFSHRDLSSESSRPTRKLDWFMEWI
jgi:hypothetical protein